MTQAYNLSQLANNLNSSGQLDATDGLVNAVPVANGGTGASSVAAAVSNLSASIYPVGSIYINAAVSTNPGTLLGFGTWVSFGSGRVLVGVDSGDSAFDTLGETGGSKDAIVVTHTHTASISDPGHRHLSAANVTSAAPYPNTTVNSSNQIVATGTVGTSGGYENYVFAGTSTDSTIGRTSNQTTGISVSNQDAGLSGTNANLQPYITVYMWRRTA